MNEFLKKLNKEQEHMVIRLNKPGESRVAETTVPPSVPPPPERKRFIESLKEKIQRLNIPLPILVVISGIVCGLLCGAIVFWLTHRDIPLSYSPSSPSATTEVPVPSVETAEEIIQKVGKLILLPQDEVPSLATVADVDSLKDQLFFKNAKNGDIVLLYANAKKAILYDLIGNRVLEVAPIIDGQ